MRIVEVCKKVDNWVKNEKTKIAFIRVLFKNYFSTRTDEVKFTLKELLDQMPEPDAASVGELIDTYVAVTSQNVEYRASRKLSSFVLRMAANRGISLKQRLFTYEQAKEIIRTLETLPRVPEKRVQLTAEEKEAMKRRLWG